MAFFGITAYGAQNVLRSARFDAYDITLFTLDEFADAYDKICEREGVSEIEVEVHVPMILEYLFRGPVPPLEMDRIMTYFRKGDMNFDSDCALRTHSTLRLSRTFSQASRPEEHIESRIDKGDFLIAIQMLQGAKERSYETEEKRPGVNFHSYDVMRTTKIKEMRPEYGPGDLFVNPVTVAQSYGWTAHQLPTDKRHSKKHCEETKFAAELLKFGIYY